MKKAKPICRVNVNGAWVDLTFKSHGLWVHECDWLWVHRTFWADGSLAPGSGSGSNWTITHAPSGMMIGRKKTKGAARSAANRVLNMVPELRDFVPTIEHDAEYINRLRTKVSVALWGPEGANE